MYNWYKRKVFIDEKFKDEQLFLTIKKSQYVTRVFVNGHQVGSSMECYTPMDFNITSAVKYGSDNEILIQVGDRAWLPSELPVVRIRRKSITYRNLGRRVHHGYR